MIVTATQKEIPVTPRKMRMMAIGIKSLKPQDAVEQLGFLNYSAAQPLQKVIKQALANATNNHKLSPDTLRFKEIVVTQGINFKRWRAAARGRGKPYTRRRSHVTVKLEDKTPQITTKPAVKVMADTKKATKTKKASTSKKTEHQKLTTKN